MKVPTDPKDVATLRSFLETVRQQACGMAEALPEPWKQHFKDLKDQFNAFLAKLPPTDQVSAAFDANHHLAMYAQCLASAASLASMLGAQMNAVMTDIGGRVSVALNAAVDTEITKRITEGALVKKEAVDGLVTAAINGKVTAGDLLDKTMHTQLCAAAKDAGILEGKKAVETENAAKAAKVTLINTRKTGLQTAGLPLPESALEHLLAGSEEEFNALKTKAEQRRTALQAKGVAFNAKSPLNGKLYLPDDQWPVFEELAISAVRGGDPLKGAGRVEDDAPAVMLV